MKHLLLIIGVYLLVGINSLSYSQENIEPYPNPYNTKDTAKPVEISPFRWNDFAVGINNSRTIKEAYKQALLDNDGYKLLQLAKIEFDNVYTYGNLVPSKILLKAYNIAIHNKDPYLAFWVLDFDSNYNLFSLVTPQEMLKQTQEIALERKEPNVLYALADLEERYNFLPEVSPKSIRMQALFINNENYAPYANPYDNPDPSKSLERTPYIWGDFPSHIDTYDEMNEAYNKALKNNDGYKLFQLAKIELNNNYLKDISIEDIFKHTYDIAAYNKDPYLLIYLAVFNQETKIDFNLEPSDIFREAYNTAIERRDPNPLYLMYNFERQHDFLPELTSKRIRDKAIEIEESYKEGLK